MKELSEKHIERLEAMPYIEYLTTIEEEVKTIHYSKGSSDSYSYSRDILRNFIKRYLKEYNLTTDNYDKNEIGASIQSTSVRLDDYLKYNKEDAIARFKADIDEDITRLKYDIQNLKK